MKTLLAFIALVLILPGQALAMSVPMLMMNDPSTPTNNTDARFVSLAPDGGFLMSSGDDFRSPMPVAGTFTNLYVRFPTALTGAMAYTITLNKGGVATALTAQITSAGTMSSDLTHSVTVAAGDEMSIAITPTGTPTAQGVIQIGAVFTPTASGESVILTQGRNSATSGALYIPLAMQSGWGTPEATVTNVFPTAGVIDRLYVTSNTQPGSGKSNTFALMVNNATSTLTCTMSNTSSTCTDTSHTVTMNPGDLVSLSQLAAGTPAQGTQNFGMRFLPTVDGESVMMSQSDLLSAGNPTFLFTGGANTNNDGTESNDYAIAPTAFTWRKLYLNFTNQPGGGKTRAMTGRINGASSALTATVSGTNTTANDTSHDVSVATGDLINWRSTVSGSPATAGRFRVGGVMYVAPPVTNLANPIFNLNGLLNLNGWVNIRG